MADKVPIRGAYNASSGLTGLANFASSETIGVAHGGTGIATVGTNQLVSGNGTGAMTSESNLTFDGSTLLVSGTASATSIMAADSGAALSSQNAKKIILVDLTDPATMWDVEEFLARVKYASWYNDEGLGNPPMRGAIWIINGQTEIVWWDLDKDVEWLSFESGTSGIAQSASPVITDIAFLDGILYVTMTTGMQLVQVDFLRDRATRTSATNNSIFIPYGIKNRNGSWGHLNYRSGAQYVIVNSAVNAVSAVRDPSAVDEFGRPKHWWAVGTNGGSSVYNPVNDAIYDTDAGSNTDDNDANAISPRGVFATIRDHSGSVDRAMGINSIFIVSSDTSYAQWGFSTDEEGALDLPFSSETGQCIDVYDGGVLAGGTLAYGTDKGLLLGFLTGGISTGSAANPSGIRANGAAIAITSDYQTPYMKGYRVAAYPLNDANDRSGSGNNLTNGSAPPYTATGPFGDCADFDGSNHYLLSGTFTTINSQLISISLYFNADSNNPSATEILASISNSNQGESYTLGLTSTNGYPFCAWDDGTASSGNVTASVDACDGQWHHLYVTRGAAVGAINKIYLDGMLIASGGAGTNQGTIDVDRIALGGRVDGTEKFNGKMAQVSISCGAGGDSWTENEINLEYERMLRGLGGATAKLANSDVKSVRIDHNSGLAAITTAANQTEIWDIETGMRQSIDATTTATINDADEKLKSGAILPEYITARSGAIEFDGQERNVLG